MNKMLFAQVVNLSIILVIGVIFNACQTTPTGSETPSETVNNPEPPNCTPAEQVSRDEVIAIAEAYRTWQWQPSKENAFHGNDSNGIRVDTPDHQFKPSGGIRPGWWQPEKINIGIPYQWGGFDTPQSFSESIAQGKYAGDVYTSAKRQQLNDAVSTQACGVDCSGFVSRCWRLKRAYSTRELPTICAQLASWDELKKGDIVNKHNDHVLIFEHWIDTDKKNKFMAYETGCPPTWKVLRHPIDVSYVKGLGYSPHRYRNIRD